MIRQKTFTGFTYIPLRTKVNKWLMKNPGVRVLHTIEYTAHRKKGSGMERVVIVQYEKV